MASVDNVRIGSTEAAVGGGVHTFTGASPTLPTNATDTLTGATSLGYISEDGVTEAQGTETEKIKAWQDNATVREVMTSHELTYEFVMIEMSDETMVEFFGPGNTLANTQITGKSLPIKPYVVHVVDGNKLIRLVIPKGQVVERQDRQFRASAAIGHGVKIQAYPDANGVKAYQYVGDVPVTP